MRTIVVGDIHGCFNELKTLILSLEEKQEYNKDTDRLIFLGDYIDRGEDSRLVIKFIRELQKNNSNVIALKGNHEDMLCNYRKDARNQDWLYNGYSETIKSYKGFNEEFNNDIQWMKTLPLYYEDDHCIYVHAGIDVTKPMDKQTKYDLLWIRKEFIYNVQQYHKRVVFGHTPTVTLTRENHPVYTYTDNIDIDTGCVFGGALTALIIEDGEVVNYYQAERQINDEYKYWD